jgi:hypothetical protein
MKLPFLDRDEETARLALLPGFDRVTYPDWDSLFSRFWNEAPSGTALVLDELPALVAEARELPSVLQKHVDRYPERKDNKEARDNQGHESSAEIVGFLVLAVLDVLAVLCVLESSPPLDNPTQPPYLLNTAAARARPWTRTGSHFHVARQLIGT